MRAGALCRILGSKSEVNRKWPKWFTPKCVSNPSSVFDFGQAMTPEKTIIGLNFKPIWAVFSRITSKLLIEGLCIMKGFHQ